MITDNWPVKHIYISRRLTRQIVEKHIAAEQGVLPSEVTLGTGDIGLTMRPRDLDLENLFVLLREATKAVEGNTGSLTDPKEYVHDTLNMVAGSFPVLMGWDRGTDKHVAGFCASQWVDGIGRVFVALFGSVHNYLDYSKVEREATGEWYPSSIEGLYQLLAETVEPEDAGVSPQWLQEDRDFDDDERCRMAARILFGMRLPPAQDLEFLAQIFIRRRGFDLEAFVPEDAPHAADAIPPYALVLIGTPIWVAKQIPKTYLEAPEPPDAAIPDAPPKTRKKHWWHPRRLGNR